MKFNLSKVEFSKKDIADNITIPKKLTPELAYLIGIHLGDGTMVFDRQKRNYYISYSGHLIDEYELYAQHIASLIKRIFNKNVKVYEDKRQKRSSIKIYFYSKAILTFLHIVLKLPCGPKGDAGIPKYIKNSDLRIKSEFIKGLADTDFSLTFKKRHKNFNYYPVININMSNKNLIKGLNKILQEFGFKTYMLLNYPTIRNGIELTTNHIDINGVNMLNLWMKRIGFTSKKHLTKYQVWKRFGFCPPNTNINQRKEILKLSTEPHLTKPL